MLHVEDHATLLPSDNHFACFGTNETPIDAE
jgi:hypothetical protein